MCSFLLLQVEMTSLSRYLSECSGTYSCFEVVKLFQDMCSLPHVSETKPRRVLTDVE